MVLNSINLAVPQGAIYGFLGPNGAGKTTTLKLILGLLKIQSGDISILGKRFPNDRIEILRSIGSLIESPSLYAHLTATENLLIWQKIYQCPTSRLSEVLKLVGLSSTGNKKISQFSLGMKQRLSIAVSLLHNPSLLILDEPTNGLDPYGILEIRELLLRMNRENGLTIIISSHLLSEIEKLVSHLGIINKGSLVFQGTLNELVSMQQQTSYIVLETNNNAKATQYLPAGMSCTIEDDGKMLLPLRSKKDISLLNRHLVENGIEVYEIGKYKQSLETIFMGLIEKNNAPIYL